MEYDYITIIIIISTIHYDYLAKLRKSIPRWWFVQFSDVKKPHVKSPPDHPRDYSDQAQLYRIRWLAMTDLQLKVYRIFHKLLDSWNQDTYEIEFRKDRKDIHQQDLNIDHKLYYMLASLYENAWDDLS